MCWLRSELGWEVEEAGAKYADELLKLGDGDTEFTSLFYASVIWKTRTTQKWMTKYYIANLQEVTTGSQRKTGNLKSIYSKARNQTKLTHFFPLFFSSQCTTESPCQVPNKVLLGLWLAFHYTYRLTRGKFKHLQFTISKNQPLIL